MYLLTAPNQFVSQPSCGPRPKAPRCGFLDLPAELRVAIYELLFRAPSTVVISPTNRHLPMYEILFRRSRGVQMAIYDPSLSFPRLPVAFLVTCRQINREGTEILYGQNKFLVEHVIPLGQGRDPYLGGYITHNFLLWHLRRSTLSLIRSIDFTASCRCGGVAFVHSEDKTRWTTNGAALCIALFPPSPIENAFHRGEMLAAPERLREVFSSINHNIMAHLGWTESSQERDHGFKCPSCGKWTL
ncbi:hypothetical protein GQ53DRAFT_748782 [Thozetella sp. PMI_491]|nr:hypothetical protein GQ53DRAFT_748782 [Thozetella sp. PMI_491]